jgi:hypothetical protein
LARPGAVYRDTDEIAYVGGGRVLLRRRVFESINWAARKLPTIFVFKITGLQFLFLSSSKQQATPYIK